MIDSDDATRNEGRGHRSPVSCVNSVHHSDCSALDVARYGGGELHEVDDD